MTSNFRSTSNGSKTMRKLSTLLPTMRWVPHDIERPAPSKKEKERPKKQILGRKGDPNHGTLRHRKSAISFSSEFDGESDAPAHMQTQSAFFTQLPIEIRKIVYEYVVGEEIVHLVFAKKKFGHFLCPSREQGVECACKVLVGGTQCKQLNGSCVRMLTTCRRMYTEAAAHLYAPHTFSLLHIAHLLFLPAHVPQQRLNTIRIVHLRWTIRALPYFTRSNKRKAKPAYPEDTANWEKGWTILASMQGLRDLKVTIIDPSPEGIWEAHWLGLECLLLESVKKITTPGLKRFMVVMPYANCRLDWDMGECNAQLVRPIEERLGDQ